MANNEFIEPQIASTNIPVGPLQQVSVGKHFVDTPSPFAGLAKTVAQGLPTLNALQAREEEADKSKAAWKAELAEIHGLVDTGNMTEEDYKDVLRKANAKAQKAGYITGYENWSSNTAIEEERSRIRLSALSSYMKSNFNKMTNPSDKFNADYKDILADFIGLNDGASVGTDSQGNPIDLNINEMSPMEQVSFARGMTVTREATRKAASEKRDALAIEGQGTLAGSNIHRTFDTLASLTKGNFDPASDKVQAALGEIGKSMSDALDAQVPNVNDIALTAISDFMMDTAMLPLQGDGVYNAELINSLATLLTEEFSHMDLNGERAMFAPNGTANNVLVESYRLNAQKALEDRLAEVSSKQTRGVEDLQSEYLAAIAAATQEERESAHFIDNLTLEYAVRARDEYGVRDIQSSTTLFSSIGKNVFSRATTKTNESALDEIKLKILQNYRVLDTDPEAYEGFHKAIMLDAVAGKLTSTQLDSVESAIKAVVTRNKSFQQIGVSAYDLNIGSSFLAGSGKKQSRGTLSKIAKGTAPRNEYFMHSDDPNAMLEIAQESSLDTLQGAFLSLSELVIIHDPSAPFVATVPSMSKNDMRWMHNNTAESPADIWALRDTIARGADFSNAGTASSRAAIARGYMDDLHRYYAWVDMIHHQESQVSGPKSIEYTNNEVDAQRVGPIEIDGDSNDALPIIPSGPLKNAMNGDPIIKLPEIDFSTQEFLNNQPSID